MPALQAFSRSELYLTFCECDCDHIVQDISCFFITIIVLSLNYNYKYKLKMCWVWLWDALVTLSEGQGHQTSYIYYIYYIFKNLTLFSYTENIINTWCILIVSETVTVKFDDDFNC